MHILRSVFLFVVLIVLMSSCAFYKQDIMFKTDKAINPAEFDGALAKAKQGYRLKKGDIISFRLFTNKGEVIIDPNYDLAKQLGESKQGAGFTKQDGSATQLSYVIDNNGFVLLPMVGRIFVDSITHKQLDSVLTVKYSLYYQEPFIVSSISNKHVVFFNGKLSKILPLGQENMNLVEAIALVGSAPEEFSDIHRIRLIRGDLSNPSVMLIDLSTIDGLKKSNLTLLPNDIIYIEPGRSTLKETMKDLGPYLSIFTSMLSLSIILLR